ncbi:MAG: LPS export ABC transporter periplasmic protein LptC [Leptospirillia bacterium]
MKPLRVFRHLLFATAFAGAVLVLGMVAERVSRMGPDETVPWQLNAELSLSGFTLEQVNEQGPELYFSADGARLLDKNQRLVADALDASFFENGARVLRLTADTGEIRMATNQVTVRGTDRPALLMLADGTTLSAPALTWDPLDRTVRSEGGASVRSDSYSAEGGQAVAAVDQQEMHLSGGVTMRWAQ